MKKDQKLNRRDFLKKAPAAVAGLAAVTGVCAGMNDLSPAAWAESLANVGESPQEKEMHGKSLEKASSFEAPKIRHYRALGKTGLELSDISMGAAVDDAVIRYAVDRGINYFDTADSYYNGQGEEAFGRVLKGMRDKCVISTKHMVEPSWNKETLIEKVNASLKRFNSDYIDLLFMQGVGDPALFKNEEILSAYDELKKQGKYRFLCFSTHDTDVVVPAAIESGLFSAAMLMYIPSMFPKMEEMHTKLYEAGLGIIAMKALKGGEGANLPEKAKSGLTFAQASIQWALRDEKISTVLISMRTFEHIDEYLKVSGSGLS
ncbi:MAG: twin-arginine translocation signal domain-containing protein [Candidatus Latescibacteria bacterium]|nr:twin-arginine translocation signal domain-containing protein [Candidatus Latescibacterota bacterium]NIO56269.1 twin-arginine translocation signal domain-containing protein [Candidatus Latescibacterota bacterium]